MKKKQLPKQNNFFKNFKFLTSTILTCLLFTATTGLSQTPDFYNGTSGASSNTFPLASVTNRVQWIYGPNLFNSGGTSGTPANSGMIDKVYFRLGSKTGTSTYINFTISLAQNVGTATNISSPTWATGLTQCFYRSSYTFSSTSTFSWYEVILDAPFSYDPSKSLIFEIKTSSTSGSNYMALNSAGGSKRRWGTYSGASASGYGSGLVDFGFDLTSNDPCANDSEAPSVTCPGDIVRCGTQTVEFAASATDNCSDVSLTYSHASGSSFEVGTTEVSVTATDAKGNKSQCSFNVVINPIPSCTINTSTETIYLGYGVQTATLTGSGGDSYTWSGTNLSNATGETTVFAPTSGDGFYTTKLTTTNEFNCSNDCDYKICVLDIRADGGSTKNPKIYICHVPNGNPGNSQTLSISVSAVSSHIGNHSGDQLGKCGQTCSSNLNKRNSSKTGIIYTIDETDLVVYPNPSKGVFNFEFEGNNDEAVNVKIYDYTGKLIIVRTNVIVNNTLTIDMSEYSTGMYHAEITHGTFRKAVILSLDH